MPELPEVETIRRQLAPELTGRRVRSLEVLDSRWCSPAKPAAVARAVAERQIEEVGRRGKYLLLRLEGERTLVMHLRMTGNLLLAEPGSPDPPHLRARLLLDSGWPSEMRPNPSAADAKRSSRRNMRDAKRSSQRCVLFTDPRRFGRALILDGAELDAYFDARLGVEPLGSELTAELLADAAAGRRGPLKSFLLLQGVIAGIGNIYADEALHRAALHPLSPAGSMRLEHCEALRAGIVAALELALANGGASIDDYRDSRGERGRMQDEFLVHRREGKPCPRCGEPIRRVVVAGRSTYFCPSCQKRLRARKKA